MLVRDIGDQSAEGGWQQGNLRNEHQAPMNLWALSQIQGGRDHSAKDQKTYSVECDKGFPLNP
jgi:hypothetical protein